jgi:hypothetical protein
MLPRALYCALVLEQGNYHQFALAKPVRFLAYYYIYEANRPRTLNNLRTASSEWAILAAALFNI